MNKIISTIVILLLTSLTGFAQSKTDSDDTLSADVFTKIVQKQFANLMGPLTNDIVGQFATFDVENAEANFAGNIVFDNGAILGIKASGSISDGVFAVFNNSELNSKLGLDIQYNFLDKKSNRLQYSLYSRQRMSERMDSLKRKLQIDRISIASEVDSVMINLQIIKKTKNLDSLKAKLKVSEGWFKRSIEIEIKKQNMEIVVLNEKLKSMPCKEEKMTVLENNYSTQLNEAYNMLEVVGFSFGWFSIRYKINNNLFRLFDSNASPENQVSKESFATQSLQFGYSYVHKTLSKLESYYYNLGTRLSTQDNFAELKKIKISEKTSYGVNPDERTSTDEYNVYQGDYSKNLKSVTFFGDFYWFLLDFNTAIHIFPEYSTIQNKKPVTNLGFGFLLAVKDNKDKTNQINSEIYLNLFDLFNNFGSDKKLFDRSSYGLRFTFPINFN